MNGGNLMIVAASTVAVVAVAIAVIAVAIEKLNPQATIVFCSSGSCPSFIPQALAGHK